jgi:hypothetical protein
VIYPSRNFIISAVILSLTSSLAYAHRLTHQPLLPNVKTSKQPSKVRPLAWIITKTKFSMFGLLLMEGEICQIAVNSLSFSCPFM